MAQAYEIHPVHLGIILLPKSGIARFLPPVGINLLLFPASASSARPGSLPGFHPFYFNICWALIIITYWPWLVALVRAGIMEEWSGGWREERGDGVVEYWEEWKNGIWSHA